MKIIIFLTIVLLISINTTNACMPFSPESIVIWEYNWKIENKLPYGNYSVWKFQFINFKDAEKPFSTSYKKLWKHYYIDTSIIDLQNYKNWDLIISISDYNNWDYDDYFKIYEIWKISCKNYDDFFIENKQWMKGSFWKEMWQCGNYKPDNVQSEQELLEKIKQKYKTCKNIGINNPNYQRNVEDDYKIYKIDKKIWKIIEKSKNPELLKEKLADRVKKLLWKSNEELSKISNFNNYELKSFTEYALIKIYRYLSYWDLISYKETKVKILENDFIKLVATLPNIYIDNDSVYLLYDNWAKWNMIEFFEIWADDNTEYYINNHILEKEYIWKCKVFIKDKTSNFTINNTYIISWYWYYKTLDYHNIADCWYYWESRSIKYFERKSDNLLIYVNAWQDYNWVDFSLLELK